MSKLRPAYFTNLKETLKVGLKSSSVSSNSKDRRWKHQPISKAALEDVVSSNKGITIMCRNGDLENARQMFDKMPHRTVVSWNAMITGYSKWDLVPEALDLIKLMHHSNVKLNETTFSLSLSICGREGSLACGRMIHGLILKCGCERFKLVGSALLYLYARCCEILDGKRVFDELIHENELLWSLMLVGYVECGFLSEAVNVFDGMPRRGVVEWTTLISGHSKSEDGCEKALKLFRVMREVSEADPNEFTFDCVVRACARLGDLRVGRVVHGLVIKFGFELECAICVALFSLYCDCGVVDDANRVYDSMENPGLDETNELISGLVNLGKIEEAELIFNNMVEQNPVSYNLMIKGYAMCSRFEDSKRLFMQMPRKMLTSINTMIRVYARNGEIDKALELFEEAKSEGNPITWNSMISGCIQNDHHENGLHLYLTMRRLSISQSRSTFSVLFRACACLGSLQQGKSLHAHLAKTPFSTNVYVGTALITMYSKCGSISDAKAAFDTISSPNVAAWTALISGLAHHGLGHDAVSSINRMLENGLNPNALTFVAVLSACAHSGLVDEGMRLFNSMRERYSTIPTVEHLTCVVSLLGRAGLLHEAEELIEKIPVEADKILLISMLNASWFWMDMNVGERLVEKMFGSDPKSSSSAGVIMSNMYSVSGKWWQKLMIRDSLRGLGVKKDPGCSWVDINSRTHVFSVNDRNNPMSDMIYASLGSLRRNSHPYLQHDVLSYSHFV